MRVGVGFLKKDISNHLNSAEANAILLILQHSHLRQNTGLRDNKHFGRETPGTCQEAGSVASVISPSALRMFFPLTSPGLEHQLHDVAHNVSGSF